MLLLQNIFSNAWYYRCAILLLYVFLADSYQIHWSLLCARNALLATHTVCSSLPLLPAVKWKLRQLDKTSIEKVT